MKLKSIVRGLSLVLIVVVAGCATRKDAAVETGERPLGTGFRYSAYGPDWDPGPAYWLRVGQEMAARFPGAVGETVWRSSVDPGFRNG